ncbi:conserved hypothetical protein [Planktothrix serta PCC 8927]|uniref:Uncharacterized protein n=1 Tax=Planktothrix serta PCC 8927 TaxID=671068 RepID=A0A7Z9BQD9_9CYAN|nr:hypothetical protein [Planktothrix serta]VXD18129.1 conserved hypothetical protein [Planktothrix serta PCC 8927]
MSAQDQSRRELAKSGDPKAIADAINHSLKAKGINADVMRDNGCLHVMLEGDQVPNHQKDLVNFVRNGMDRLGVETIYTIRVYGRQFGDDLPLWEEEIVLRTPPEPAVNQINNVYLDESSVPLVDEDEDDENEDEDEDEDYNIDDEIIDDDYIVDEDEYLPPRNNNVAPPYNPEEDDDPDDGIDETTRQVEPEKAKSKVLLFILLGGLALVAILAGLHLTGIFRLPFLPGGSSSSPESAPSGTTSTPPASGSPQPAASPAASSDPFKDGVRTATNAANLAQTAKTKAEWTKVAATWGQASALMKKVPQSHPQFAIAQDRVVLYATNQKVTQQKAAAAPN